MILRQTTGVALSVIALAACWGDPPEDAPSSTTTTTSTPTTTITATTITATTSPPPVTTAPSITPAATLTTPPATAPPTTLDPQTELAAAVEQDWREALRLFRVAQGMNPSDTAATFAALEYRTGAVRDGMVGILAGNLSRNERIRQEPLVEPTLTIESGPDYVPGRTDQVEMQTCEIDSWVLVEVGGAPDGGDAVVDDNIYAYRSRVTMKLEDGRWKIALVTRLESWVGAIACVA